MANRNLPEEITALQALPPGSEGPRGPEGPPGSDSEVPGPKGDPGATGPEGPSAVSADADNSLILGSDGLPFYQQVGLADIPDPAANQITGLVKLSTDNTKNRIAFICEGAVTVTWGDGSDSQDYASGITAEHNYDWEDVPVFRGSRTCIITCKAQAGQEITSANFQVPPSGDLPEGWAQWVSPLIVLNLNLPDCTNLKLASDGMTPAVPLDLGGWGIPRPDFSLPDSWLWGMLPGSPTQQVSLLQVEAMQITTGPLSNAAGLFYGCKALVTLEGMPDLSVTTSIDSLFLNCMALLELSAIVAPEATSATEVFALCKALKNIDSISLPKAKSLTGFYRGTESLTSFPMFDTSQVEQVTSMFSSVYTGAEVPLYDFASVIWADNIFMSSRVTTVPLFVMPNVRSISNAFSYSDDLATVPAWDISSAVWARSMSQYAPSLTTYGVTGLGETQLTKEQGDAYGVGEQYGGTIDHSLAFLCGFSSDSDLITGPAINAFFESLVDPAPQFYALEYNGTETYNNTPLINLPTPLPSGTDTTIATNKGWRTNT